MASMAPMTGRSVKACIRCHGKKIRCTGVPDCRNCSQAHVRCELYVRPRKSDVTKTLKEAQRRVQWLEDELSRELGFSCRSCTTGTSLSQCQRASSALPGPAAPLTTTEASGSTFISSHNAPSPRMASSAPVPSPSLEKPSAGSNDAAEISLLALNATGELRYLGPSSGALFANCATAVVRSCSSGQGQEPWRRQLNPHVDRAPDAVELPQTPQHLSLGEVQLLLGSYKMWVHALYPLLRLESLERLVTRCAGFQAIDVAHPRQRSELNDEMTMFYLVMALGAMNRANTLKQLQLDTPKASTPDRTTTVPSPTQLYSMALRYFDLSIEHLRPSIFFIQIILLICIYSSHGPVGSSQWQIAGLAMRTAVEIGLHHAPKGWQAPNKELDERSRVFWTAYIIEIVLSYNLGRPPSIRDEHITAWLPGDSGDAAFGILHIEHRRIQSKIVSQVYAGIQRADEVSRDPMDSQFSSSHATRGEDDTAPLQQNLISGLQSELDMWRSSLQALFQSNTAMPYPHRYWDRLYHGTTFVLHRASPLYPHPSEKSLELCVRNAGAYIDDVTELLRTSNIPLTWMLVQGVLFAGLTMLLTARTDFRILASRAGLPLLLVDLPAWSRKCAVCLAIVNERWSEDLLSKLETQFEALANDTLGAICAELTEKNFLLGQTSQTDIGCAAEPTTAASLLATSDGQDMPLDELNMNGPTLADVPLPASLVDLEDFDLFNEFLSFDGGPMFWDINASGQGMPMPI